MQREKKVVRRSSGARAGTTRRAPTRFAASTNGWTRNTTCASSTTASVCSTTSSCRSRPPFLIQSLRDGGPAGELPARSSRPSPGLHPSRAATPPTTCHWAALYGVTGSVAPPPEEFLVTVAHIDTKNVGRQDQGLGGKTFDAQLLRRVHASRVPENYKAISGYVQRMNVRYDAAAAARHTSMEFFIGEQYFVRFGPTDIASSTSTFTMNGETGDMPVTVERAPTCHPVQLRDRHQLPAHRQSATSSGSSRRMRRSWPAISASAPSISTSSSRYQAAVRDADGDGAATIAHDPSVEREELKKASSIC